MQQLHCSFREDATLSTPLLLRSPRLAIIPAHKRWQMTLKSASPATLQSSSITCPRFVDYLHCTIAPRRMQLSCCTSQSPMSSPCPQLISTPSLEGTANS